MAKPAERVTLGGQICRWSIAEMPLYIFLAVLLAGSNGSATAVDAARHPTDKWVAEYADDMCLLQRNYGTEAAPLVLAFRPQPLSAHLTAYVFESGPKKQGGWVTAEVRLGTATPVTEKPAAAYFAPKPKLRVMEFGMTREELELAAASGLISIDVKDRLEVAFRVPGLSSALSVLDDCVADLLATWGFSREQQRAMASPPVPQRPLHRYVHANDYPAAALRNYETGWNSARYRIDALGRVSDCRIVESSGSRTLDATLCRVVGRYRYRPALDHSGKPMDSLGFVRIRWQIA